MLVGHNRRQTAPQLSKTASWQINPILAIFACYSGVVERFQEQPHFAGIRLKLFHLDDRTETAYCLYGPFEDIDLVALNIQLEGVRFKVLEFLVNRLPGNLSAFRANGVSGVILLFQLYRPCGFGKGNGGYLYLLL